MSVQKVSSPATQPPAANEDGSHRLKSLAISRGFLDGIRFELADGLNCLIGGRGTGKTTALELVRYVMDALPGREEDAAERKRIESLVEKNLAGGTVELEVETKDGFCYLVSRAYGEEPLVLTPDRRPTELSVRSLKALRAREQRAVAGVAGALPQLRGETARLRCEAGARAAP